MLSGIVVEKPPWREAVNAWWASLRKRERYANFDVHVERSAQGYCAVIFSAAGDVRHELDLPLKEKEGWQLPRDLASGVPGVRRPAPDSSLEIAQRLGDRLWKALFVGPILACFQREHQHALSQGKRLRIRLWLAVAPSLARLPWELLFDVSHKKFLLHDPNISLVRYLEQPEPSDRPGVEPPLHVLVAVAVPGDKKALAAEEELRWLEEALADLLKAKRVVLKLLRSATLEDMEEHLRSGACHIFHFIGHGVGGALLLEDGHGNADLLESRDLGILLRSLPSLRLVVLNACEGGLADRSDAFAGVAQALVREGVPAVLAMQSEISDRAAITFSRRFYRELAQGATLDRAVADARRAMFLRRFRIAWAAPMLFTRGFEGPIIPPRLPLGGLLALFLAAFGLALVLVLSESGWHSWYCKLLGGPPRPPHPIRVDAEECPSPAGLDIPFVLIEPNSFEMGSQKGIMDVRPAHDVTLTEPFCIGAYEVTQELWRAVMGAGSGEATLEGDHYPMTRVTWKDAQRFLGRLNDRHPGANYRLAKEAQWEFAAREGADAGTRPATSRLANCRGTARGDCWPKVAPVGQFQPNGWGLYDMAGNVGEWVEDRYDLYKESAAKDPEGPRSGSKRVWRGGSFNSSDQNCTTLLRSDRDPSRQSEDTGFRIVRDPVRTAAPASTPPTRGTEAP